MSKNSPHQAAPMLKDDPSYWLDRADQVQAIAEGMANLEHKRMSSKSLNAIGRWRNSRGSSIRSERRPNHHAEPEHGGRVAAPKCC
jgi:hypothetical protein